MRGSCFSGQLSTAASSQKSIGQMTISFIDPGDELHGEQRRVRRGYLFTPNVTIPKRHGRN